ncbi:homoserine kinase, partial [Streptomyces sp. NPDC048213]
VVRVADSGLHIDIAGEGADTLPRDEKSDAAPPPRRAAGRRGAAPAGRCGWAARVRGCGWSASA